MKKVLNTILSVAAAILFFSCTSHLQESVGNELVQKDLTFEASLCESNPTPVSKTSAEIDAGGLLTSVLWSKNDAINVFFVANEGTGNVTAGKFTNTSETPSERTSFSGSIDIFSGTFESPVSEQMFWAVYPYDENNSCDGSAITFSIPAKQSCPAGTFADGQWPTMARSNGLNLPFYAVCSGIKFKVLNDNVTSVTFTNKDGGAINGTVTAGWDNNLPSISSVTDGTAQIVVTPEGTDTFTAGSIYFAVLPTVTMSEGIEVTYKTATSHCTYTNSGEINFTRNKFNTLYDKDEAYENDPVFTRVDEVKDGGRYIMVNNGMALFNNGSTIDKVDVSEALASDFSSINYKNINIDEITDIVWDWTTSTLDDEDYGTYTVTNSGVYYMFVSGSYDKSDTYNGYRLQFGALDSSKAKYYVWNYTEQQVLNGGTHAKRYLSYVADAWNLPPDKASNNTYLYEYIETRAPQELSFSSSTAEYDLGTSAYTVALPTLSGAQTTVTYTSSDPETASVTGDGTVTPIKKGTVTITAKAAATAMYAPATASYTLTIIDSRVKYYVKVTDGQILDGTYLIVSSNYAFDVTATSNSSYITGVSPSDGKIEQTDDLAGAAIEITAKDGKYFLKTSRDYVFAGSASGSPISFSSTKDDKYLHTITYSSTNKNFSIKNKGEYSSERNLRYSSSNKKFQYSSSSGTFDLYLLEGSAKASRDLAFAETSVQKNISDGDFTIALTGTLTGTTVTYGSSKENVATV